jgi:flagellar FliL protein
MAASDTKTEKGEEAAEAAAKPKRGLLPIIIIVVVTLVVGAGGGFAASMFAGGLLGGHGDEGELALNRQPEKPIFFELPEMVVRLEGGEGQYLKLATVLDLRSEEALETVKSVEPRLLDTLQTYLVELSPDDLKGTAGMYRVRQELLRRVNDTVPGTTMDVLFKTLIVQ